MEETLNPIMDPALYEVVANGNVVALEKFEHDRLLQMTHQKSTSLQVAVQFRNEECVKMILRECPSSLLLNQNMKGDTALHTAVRLGLRTIVELLIDKAKHLGEEDIENGAGKENIVRMLIKMANNNNDTALHLAVRGHELKVVKHLIAGFPEFEYFPNHAGETPLYLAALLGWHDAVRQILKNCKSSAHSGPGGKTALHASVMVRNKGIIRTLLREKPAINKEADKDGWVPLHYAAPYHFFYDKATLLLEAATLLLEADRTVAYIQDKRGLSPLHVAAAVGQWSIVRVILEHCPDSWELLDRRGRNYLHIAIIRRQSPYFLIENIRSEESINQADNEGNTPLHLAAICNYDDTVKLLSKVDGVNIDALNKENQTALYLLGNRVWPKERHLKNKLLSACMSLETGRKRFTVRNIDWEDFGKSREDYERIEIEEKKRMREKMEKASSNHLVVSALIATVAFAAGFALPGGHESDDSPDKGMATLIKATSFRVFVISNTIAMLLSSLAVLIHFFTNLCEEENTCEEDNTDTFLMSAFHCTFGAILAMMLAFITGTYSVLAHAPGLAIATCAIGCIFYPASFYSLYYGLRPNIVRRFFYLPISCLRGVKDLLRDI